jgi:hypothetical protein
VDATSQLWLNRLVGVGVVVLVGYLTLEATPTGAPKVPATRDATASTGDAGAAPSAPAAPRAAGDAGTGAVTELNLPFALTLGEPDGGALSATAPRTVRLGVVLVAWAGAEGARPAAPGKPEALLKATRLAQLARTDWNGAVKEGDPESSLDIGRIPRRVLDPRTEIAVFNLAPGEISEPLETPRGFWVVKRIE